MRTGTPGFRPERLVEAREVRGLTQLALGELIGKPNTSISRWEKGTHLPENDALESLSKALRVPVAFFMQPVVDHGAKPVFFRSMVSATKQVRKRTRTRLRWLQEIVLVLNEWIEFPPVDIPFLDVRNFKDIRERDIEDAADQCRIRWGLGEGPISDVLLVLENAGVIVGKEETGSAKMDGLSHWSSADDRPYILIASDKNACVRSRFDAAHELGHLVLHQFVSPDVLKKGSDFKEIEEQAFHFASAFLMPSDSFGSEIWSPSLSTFLALKERWKTSIGAMIMRSGQLEMITKEHQKKLWKYYSSRGWRKGEPFDDEMKPEQPRLLRRSIKLLLDESVRSRNELLSDFRLDALDVESLCSLPHGYLSHGPAEIIKMPRIRKKETETQKEGKGKGKVIPFEKSSSDS